VSEAARRGGAQIIPRPEIWRPGGPPPWPASDVAHRFGADSVGAAVARRSLSPEPPALAEHRRSAVLIAFYEGPRGAEVILTRRSRALRSHRGEISFPGGRLEPGETPEDGARREAHEEVDLAPGDVELIGRLGTLATVSSMSSIVPVVGRLPERPRLRPQQAEVDRILYVPLLELVRPEVFREERWGTPPLERPIYFFELVDETIWGATARILVDLLVAAASGPP
jgi:8-oxo-dGTP pyrophosphatase MutT (NUDIX family)